MVALDPAGRIVTIAVLPGDGIGPEVVEQALLTVDRLGLDLDVDVLDHVNAAAYRRTGVALGEADLARIVRSSAVLLGAVGGPAEYARAVLLRLRFDLDLYVNYRPVRLLHDRLSPLRDEAVRGIDCVIVRENTEGLYSGMGGALRTSGPHEVAIDNEVSTAYGVSRVIAHAFSIARREVCMVDKSNAVPHGGGLWQRCFASIAGRYGDISARHLYVDVAAMELVRDPTQFDVIVTNNSYGDILSDLAAQVAGGIGTAASANINPGSGFGLYEPVHGSAPDIAGQGLANPVGAILSAALLLADLGHAEAAAAIERAVEKALAAGHGTPDLGGTLDTAGFGEAIRAGL